MCENKTATARIRANRLRCVVAAASLWMAAAVHATPITFEFTALITEVTGLDPAWVGLDLTGTIVMDLSDPLIAGDIGPNASQYGKRSEQLDTSWLQVSLRNPDGSVFSIGQTSIIDPTESEDAYTDLYNRASDDPQAGYDRFSTYRSTYDPADPDKRRTFGLLLQGAGAQAMGLVSSADYFDVAFDPLQANIANYGWFDFISGTEAYQGYGFTVTSLARAAVPEPATASMLAMGLLLSVAFARTRNRPT